MMQLWEDLPDEVKAQYLKFARSVQAPAQSIRANNRSDRIRLRRGKKSNQPSVLDVEISTLESLLALKKQQKLQTS
mgnify:CR=1 FL=1